MVEKYFLIFKTKDKQNSQGIYGLITKHEKRTTNILKKNNSLIWLIICAVLCFQWYIVKFLKLDINLFINAFLPGICIIASAFILSWAADLSQFYIPQSLAMVFLALIAVIPEYAVDMYFAWTAGKNPEYISYAAANMTGGNRLLVGLGWSLLIIIYWLKTKKNTIVLDKTHNIEINTLLIATIYSFIIPLKSNLNLIDTFVLLSIFVLYIIKISKLGIKEPELEYSPVEIISKFPHLLRGLITLFMFVFAGYSIYISAEPFSESLLNIGRTTGIDKFILVQWIAPLSSEAPELIVAFIYALKLQSQLGLRVVISSKINQWTLLIGMLALIYNISSGKIILMQLDTRQIEEILLTSSQSLFALLLIKNLKFSLLEGCILFVLFITQLFFPSTMFRFIYSGLYLMLSGYILLKKH